MKSQGLGDTIEKITAATGIKYVIEAITKATGEDCGCEGRKTAMNNPKLLINKTFYKIN